MGLKKQLCLLIGAMSLSCLGLAASPQVAMAQGAECKLLKLSRNPVWMSGGFWSKNSDLVLLDNSRRSFLSYAQDGRVRPDVFRQLTKTLNDLPPLNVAQRGDGQTGDRRVIVQTEYNRFLIYSPSYAFESSVDVTALPTQDEQTIERIYTWAPTWRQSSRKDETRDIVAFADLKKGDQWSTGVVRFSIDDQGQDSRATFLGKNLSPQTTSRTFHRLGYPYIAALKADAYVLLMDDGFQLWKSVVSADGSGDWDLVELKKFRETFPHKDVPTLPSFRGPNDYAEIMSEIEKEKIPTGLYSWHGNLYVVWRQPRKDGRGTEWLLSKVDHKTGAVGVPLTIPSGANHLLAVPGQEWALIEKGPAQGLTVQEVLGVKTCSAASLLPFP